MTTASKSPQSLSPCLLTLTMVQLSLPSFEWSVIGQLGHALVCVCHAGPCRMCALSPGSVLYVWREQGWKDLPTQKSWRVRVRCASSKHQQILQTVQFSLKCNSSAFQFELCVIGWHWLWHDQSCAHQKHKAPKWKSGHS